LPVRTEGVTAYILNEYIEGSLLYCVSVKLGLFALRDKYIPKGFKNGLQ
jgi:hypothetical protein